MEKQRNHAWMTHVAVWSVFIAYEIAVVHSLWSASFPVVSYLFNYAANILLFYVNAHLVFKRTLGGNRRSYFLLLIFILLELAAYLLLKYETIQLKNFLHLSAVRQYTTFSSFFTESIWRAVYFIGLSTGYWFAMNIMEQRKEIADLLTRRLQSELERQTIERNLLTTQNAYLRSQINPHFLFNTLGFIHDACNQFSPALGDTVMKLSDMMRYAISGPGKDDKVFLEEEIEQVQHLFALNRLRFDNRQLIRLTVSGEGTPRIIPLLVVTLAENVFKHADLFDPLHPASISVVFTPSDLRMTISNKKNIALYKGTGLGMKNVRLRLEQHYPGKYRLEINNTGMGYHLELYIGL